MKLNNYYSIRNGFFLIHIWSARPNNGIITIIIFIKSYSCLDISPKNTTLPKLALAPWFGRGLRLFFNTSRITHAYTIVYSNISFILKYCYLSLEKSGHLDFWSHDWHSYGDVNACRAWDHNEPNATHE